MNRIVFSILTSLDKSRRTLSSVDLARDLGSSGIDLSERTVRHYLKLLDSMGYTVAEGKKGRKITPKGKEELSRGFVSARVGFVINKINSLSFATDLSLETGRGRIILNLTYIPKERVNEALELLAVILQSPYSVSSRIILRETGERLGDVVIPEGQVGIGTVCSITLNGVFLKAGIPVVPRYGGIVEVRNDEPQRFLSVISYEGSSVAPLELFMKSRMTDVLGAVNSGDGRILGSFREIPEVSLADAKRLHVRMTQQGFGGIILFGQTNEPLLGVPVAAERAGVVVLGGLNPIAALEEAGIALESHAMAMLIDYSALSPVDFYKNPGLMRTTDVRTSLEAWLRAGGQEKADYWSVFRA
jgi:repressor of nif and glnA expression